MQAATIQRIARCLQLDDSRDVEWRREVSKRLQEAVNMLNEDTERVLLGYPAGKK